MTEQTGGLLALHRDAEAARRTIERLSLAGVDAGRIELLTAEADLPEQQRSRSADRGALGRLGGGVLRGMAVGAAVGMVLGLWLMALLQSGLSGAGAVMAAVGGGVGGAGIGLLAGLLSRPVMSEAWSRTFVPQRPGPVVLGIRAADTDDLDAVERILADSDAYQVRRVADVSAAAELLNRASGS